MFFLCQQLEKKFNLYIFHTSIIMMNWNKTIINSIKMLAATKAQTLSSHKLNIGYHHIMIVVKVNRIKMIQWQTNVCASTFKRKDLMMSRRWVTRAAQIISSLNWINEIYIYWFRVRKWLQACLFDDHIANCMPHSWNVS